MCNDRCEMFDFKKEKPKEVNIANGDVLMTAGRGSVQVTLKDNCVRTISNVYLVPELSVNLLSVSAMVKKGYDVVFSSDGCIVSDGEEVLASATLRDGVYQLDAIEAGSALCSVAASKVASVSLCLDTGDSEALRQEEGVAAVEQAVRAPSTASQSQSAETQELWHRRLGHLNSRSMELLKKELSEDTWHSTPDYGSIFSTAERRRGERKPHGHGESALHASRCWSEEGVLGRSC
ncbi:uncharacterized protein [Choristoneura fumiferana]|uniref:uncharacterized protein n=1 Tax=Choristoneura fumiferana TaxID=7141 RepID=UPI003D1599A1